MRVTGLSPGIAATRGHGLTLTLPITPSCSSSFSPQHTTRSSSRRAHVDPSAAANATAHAHGNSPQLASPVVDDGSTARVSLPGASSPVLDAGSGPLLESGPDDEPSLDPVGTGTQTPARSDAALPCQRQPLSHSGSGKAQWPSL